MIFRRKRAPKPPPPPCPECGKPTNLGGRFCRACGWDADVDEKGEGYLDGVVLPEDEGLTFTRERTRWQWLLSWSTLLALIVAMFWTAVFGW